MQYCRYILNIRTHVESRADGRFWVRWLARQVRLSFVLASLGAILWAEPLPQACNEQFQSFYKVRGVMYRELTSIPCSILIKSFFIF
jgi:hypothetical protein